MIDIRKHSVVSKIKFCYNYYIDKEMTMDELEAAFFYGDFSSIRDLISELLYENEDGTTIPADF